MYDYMFGTQDTKDSKFTVEQDIYNEFETIEDNPDQAKATADAQASVKDAEVLRYAGKMISRDMIISKLGVNHGLDEAIIRVYKDIRGKMEKDEEYFTVSKSGSRIILFGVNEEGGTWELVCIRLADIIAAGTKFEQVVNLLSIKPLRVVDVAIGT